MHLAYALLADAAQYSPDGKLGLLGGDIDTFLLTSFPGTYPALSLVVKLMVQPTECGRDHRLRVELIDADGERLQPEIELGFSPEVKTDKPYRPIGAVLVMNMQRLSIPKAGDYAFHILIDNLELGTVPFAAKQGSPVGPTLEQRGI